MPSCTASTEPRPNTATFPKLAALWQFVLAPSAVHVRHAFDSPWAVRRAD